MPSGIPSERTLWLGAIDFVMSLSRETQEAIVADLRLQQAILEERRDRVLAELADVENEIAAEFYRCLMAEKPPV